MCELLTASFHPTPPRVHRHLPRLGVLREERSPFLPPCTPTSRCPAWGGREGFHSAVDWLEVVGEQGEGWLPSTRAGLPAPVCPCLAQGREQGHELLHKEAAGKWREWGGGAAGRNDWRGQGASTTTRITALTKSVSRPAFPVLLLKEQLCLCLRNDFSVEHLGDYLSPSSKDPAPLGVQIFSPWFYELSWGVWGGASPDFRLLF